MTTLTMPRAELQSRGTISAIWEFRELLRTLTVRNLKVKYKRSVLGFVWTLLNPLLTVAVLVGVFTYVVRIDMPGYWAFLVSGFFVWNFILLVLNASTQTLAEHAALARSVAVPSEVFVVATVGSRLVLLQILMSLGLVLPIATLSVFYDDVQHALPVLLLMLFYVSPVFYTLRLVPEAFRWIYDFNPIARLLTAFHTTLYYGQFPALGDLAILALISVGLCVLGFAVFNRFKSVFVEIL